MCENVPEEIAKKGKELRSNLLPLKSKNAYEKVYVSFQDWKNKNRIKEVTEDVILAFLDMRVSTYLVKFIKLNYLTITVAKVVTLFFMARIFNVKGHSKGKRKHRY